MDKYRLHKNSNTPTSARKKRQIFRKFNQAVAFENFMHTKFVGQKRFSLEGAEALIPALDALIEKGADIGVEEFVMGKVLEKAPNVLANIFTSNCRDIFSESKKEYEDIFFW